VEAWLNYSLVLALREQFTEAIQLLGKALIKNPGEARILYRRAGYLYRIGKIEEAYFDIEEAVKLNFDEHEELLNYLPELIQESRFIEILDLYKKPNN
jgi:tetratricopeptide (TPR) repeat protein